MTENNYDFGGSLTYSGGAYEPIIDWGSFDTAFDYGSLSGIDYSDAIDFNFDASQTGLTTTSAQDFSGVLLDNPYQGFIDTANLVQLASRNDPIADMSQFATDATSESLLLEESPPLEMDDPKAGIEELVQKRLGQVNAKIENMPPPTTQQNRAAEIDLLDKRLKEAQLENQRREARSDRSFYAGIIAIGYNFWKQDQEAKRQEDKFKEMMAAQQEQFRIQQETEMAKLDTSIELQRMRGEQAIATKLAGRGGKVERGEYQDYA